MATVMEQSPLLKTAYPTFADRLALLATLVGNMNQLRLRSGQSAGGMDHYLKQGGEPTRPVLESLARAAGVYSGFLVDGSGPIRPIPLAVRTAVVQTYLRFLANKNEPDAGELRIEFVNAYNNEVVVRDSRLAKLCVYELVQWVEEFFSPVTDSDFVQVPFFDLDTVDDQSFEAGALAGARRSAVVSMRRDILEQWKLDPAYVVMFVVHQEEQSLKPGDWVLCDCRPSTPPRTGLYVVKDEGEFVVRRIVFIGAERVRVFLPDQSDDGGSDETVERSLGELKLIGRVVMFHRRLRG